MITRDDQIRCVKREIAMRRGVYPKWIAQGKMDQNKANREIEVMEAVLKTLEEHPTRTSEGEFRDARGSSRDGGEGGAVSQLRAPGRPGIGIGRLSFSLRALQLELGPPPAPNL